MFNPFGKKKRKASREEYSEPMPSPSRPRGIPTAEVQALSSRGVAEPDIINTLRREGYAISEIDQAMKEALKGRVAPEGSEYYGPPSRPQEPYEPEPLPPPEPLLPETGRRPIREERGIPPSPIGEFSDVPRGDDFSRAPPESFREPEFPEELPEPPPERRRRTKGVDRREIEELTEVVVEEKLRGLDERFNSIQSQFREMNNKINIISEEVKGSRISKGGEVKGIEDKIDSYKQDLNTLNGRIESLERALKESLSPMLDSLRSLSETVKLLKKKE
jgi:DNA-binding transcriptional MerR regulator